MENGSDPAKRPLVETTMLVVNSSASTPFIKSSAGRSRFPSNCRATRRPFAPGSLHDLPDLDAVDAAGALERDAETAWKPRSTTRSNWERAIEIIAERR
jgi:hypothetical protein